MKLMRVTEPEKVLKMIKEEFTPLESEPVNLIQAGGRSLSEDIYSPEDVPGFNRSTVDGYALAADDSFGASDSMPAFLDYAGEGLMGKAVPAIKIGQCLLVHTGGMLPEGANAVVMIEDSDRSENLIQLYRQVAPGENVIHRGEDLKKGDLALKKGHKLRAPEIGMLASIGITSINVYRQPKIGFFSSGDELVEYTALSLEPGKIRDSNAPALLYMAKQFGAEAVYGGILPDVFETFLQKSRDMLDQVDFLVFSGGSSVGSKDFTAKTMEELGKPGLLVEGVAIQPGKPTLLARCGNKPVLGLPGHPVSALNIFAIFGRAIIEQLGGSVPRSYSSGVKAELSRNIPSRSGRTDYVRIKLDNRDGRLFAVPVFGRSGMLRTLAEADGLLVIEAAREGILAGEMVDITIWN